MPFEAVLIAGPTASGKSAVAAKLAQEFGGAVVNADSMQVYRELRILSGRPSAEEMGAAAHMLYGFVSVMEPFSVAKWLDAARLALKTSSAQGLVPIFTGGTGLYFSALTQGLAPVPDIHAQISVEVRQLFAQIGAERFHMLLASHDPAMGARLNPQDGHRMIRAYEVFEATGVSLAEWQEIKGEPLLAGELLTVVVKPNRDWLYARINRRFDAMMQSGALDEVRSLRALNIPPERPAMRALGVPPLMAHLEGTLPLDDAIAEAKTQTRRYAKRQMTWFRHQMPDWQLIEEQSPEIVFARIAGRLQLA